MHAFKSLEKRAFGNGNSLHEIHLSEGLLLLRRGVVTLEGGTNVRQHFLEVGHKGPEKM